MEDHPKVAGVTESIKESFTGIGEGIKHGAQVLMGERAEVAKQGETIKQKAIDTGNIVKGKVGETSDLVKERLNKDDRNIVPGDDPYHNAKLRSGTESLLAPETSYSSRLKNSIINEEKPN